MKNSDFIRIAKINLKERKKTTKSTVRGITFGLILLIPLLFITMAFYVDLNKTVNANPTIRNFELGVIDNKTDEVYSTKLYKEYIEKIEKADGVKTLLKYQSFVLNNNIVLGEGHISSCISFILDGVNYPVNISTDLNTQFNDIGFDVYENLNPSLSYEKDVLKDGEYFSGAKGEIMVSTSFLEKYNFTNNDVIGKLISIDTLLNQENNITTSKTEIINELEEEEGTKVSILKNYRIVGVFNSNIYSDTIRTNSLNQGVDTYFWINVSSIDKEAYYPEKILFEKKGIGGYIFKVPYFYYLNEPTVMSKKATDNGYVFFPIGFGVDTDAKKDSSLIIEMKDYKSADNLATIIDKYLKLSSTNLEAYSGTIYMNEAFSSYRTFYKVLSYVCIVFGIFGGVVFFTNLLNLYNTINYSVQSRMNYIGLTRAIGMKSNDVIKQYFIEIIEIFKRSYLWSAIIGGALSLIIKFIFDYLMLSDITSAVTIKFSLNAWYILLSFGIIVVINTLIAIIFAYVAAHNVANKPILETLIEDK